MLWRAFGVSARSDRKRQTVTKSPRNPTRSLSETVHGLANELARLERDGRNGEADSARKTLRDLAGYREEDGTWRIRCMTPERQAELGL